jgi:hypothetical protein
VTRTFLRARALAEFLLAFVLLAASWEQLYDVLSLPTAQPELFAQIAGAAMLALSYLLWIAPRYSRLTHAVALAVAFADVLAAVVLLAWLLRGDVDGALLWALVPLSAAAAVVEGVIASRSVAMLVPGD